MTPLIVSSATLYLEGTVLLRKQAPYLIRNPSDLRMIIHTPQLTMQLLHHNEHRNFPLAFFQRTQRFAENRADGLAGV
jgi:hypothetical protein